MTDFSDGSLGKFYLDYASQDPHSSSIRRKFTPPCAECKNRNVDSNYREIVLLREIKEEDIQIMNMKQMPGFQVSWFYGEQSDSHLNAATSLDLYQEKSINDTRFIDKFELYYYQLLSRAQTCSGNCLIPPPTNCLSTLSL